MVDLFFYAITFGIAVIAGFFCRESKVPFWWFLVGWIAYSLFFGVHPTKFGKVLLTGLIGGGVGYLWNQEQRKEVEQPERPEE